MPTPGVYLTFDDGPHSSATPEVLKVLQAHRVLATFFFTGSRISGREALVKEVASEGHTIGIHGFQHSRIPALSEEKTRREILTTEDILRPITPMAKKIYRPPYGFFSWASLAAARKLSYQTILWTVLAGDFRNWSNSRVVSTAVSALSEGCVIVFHDNERTQGRIGPIVSECLTRIEGFGYRLQSI